MIMENEEASSAARPSIAFPLGFALLLILLFCTSGFLSCCLHWNKIRSRFRPFTHDSNYPRDQTNISHLHQKPSPLHMVSLSLSLSLSCCLMSKENQAESVLVSMPGDGVPKFVAIKCPCKPAILEKVTVTAQRAPTLISV
ncbi:hypothetical protein JRO89_XS07G0101600 [Xanthoceras sorbifolium]|uniref:Hydroxyproline-rich glycoprotein family protein n=1 Tax=Xanthoceras sorbifolium TaxID=99658 RepID=A0ABQ8HTF5_9ROSI|nr:hypothetical protein JRO89_XS07G0101600 [Xanthoceras sorbifolium]